MYHITKAEPGTILSEGLTIDPQRGYWRDAESDFNPAAIYFYDDLAHTRRLKPRSRVHLYRVDVEDLPLESDRWGGEGAWRCAQEVGPERITYLHTYEPFEKPLSTEPS